MIKRRVYIKKRDVKQYGMTGHCRGCKSVNRGGVSRNHSEGCRDRFMIIFEKDGDERLLKQAEQFLEGLEMA